MKKDIVLVLCVVLAVAGIAMAVMSMEKQRRLGKSLEEERYSRMVAEESLQKNAAKFATLENQLESTEGKMAKLKDVLDQEKSVNQDLKSQYERLEQSKANLEAKLQETLGSAGVESEPVAPPVVSGAQ